MTEAYTTRMSQKEIAEHFGKSPQAVSMAVKRMIARTGHPEWRIKDKSGTFIAPEGVQWLADHYFAKSRLPSEDMTEVIRLQAEVSKLNQQLLSEREVATARTQAAVATALAEAAKANQQALLEYKQQAEADQDKLQAENDELRAQLDRIQRRGLWARILNKPE